MTERRVNEVLEEWRHLERLIAGKPRETAERAQLHARIREVRAEYQRLTAETGEGAADKDLPADEPAGYARPTSR